MNETLTNIGNTNWNFIHEQLHASGYAIMPGILSTQTCQSIIAQYDNDALFRKTIVMERYRFGLGAYKYYKYPLPSLIQQIRETVYSNIAPVANKWMEVLQTDKRYPPTLVELHEQCRMQGQDKPTVLLLKYGEGGYNTLHQDLYGEVYFPLQIVLFLNEPGKDYTGGEFVLTEQVPRAQSKAIVLQPRLGDILIFTTNFRPVKGTKGYYRVNMKHGVSKVQSGNRHTLGIIFHDAS